MRILISLLILFFTCFSSIAQQVNVYDFNDRYYKKTDFSKTDTLDKWSFRVAVYQGDLTDSVKPIGAIVFFRNEPLMDEKYYEINRKLWQPSLLFEVFHLKDSLFCRSISNRVRESSSCIPPLVGGDILFVGDYILLNRSVCNAFIMGWTNGADYPRPVINTVFNNVALEKIHSFEDFVRLLPIKGELLKK